MSTKPTGREVRILRNLGEKNWIWEALGRKNFVQFDELSGGELIIRQREIDHLLACGWIRLVRQPKAAQRLDRYELTDEGAALEGLQGRKMPRLEMDPLPHVPRLRRA